MNKEQQDKLWNELSEEYKDYIKERYLKLRDTAATADCMLTELFGYDNLNSKQIKTWEDVAIHNSEIWDEVHKVITTISGCSRIGNKLLNKLIATIQIAKLIELGYGGMVSEEEWKDENTEKWSVLNNHNFGDFDIVKMTIGYGWKSFISFHTQEQAKEFMSYESNRKLVKQYYMM